MEKEIVASKTLKAVGMNAYYTECKQAEREGYKVLGNPEVIGNQYSQVVVKYQNQEVYQ